MKIPPLFVRSILMFLLAMGCFCQALYALDNGQIAGTVTNKETGEVLPGANCILRGSAMGAISDINGEFRIVNIPPGSYTLRISYIGYQILDTPIRIQGGDVLRKALRLAPVSLQFDGLTVTAQREGQVAAINQQLAADGIKNVVALERIQEVPDANAAESVSRLPGISLARSGGEGTKVIVRGLSPKYNKMTLNGISIPSTDSKDRSSDLSMISSENLAGIEVFKAPTPDMEADAIGGTVNLLLAKAKDRPDRVVRLYGAYNQQEQDARQYKAYARLSQRVVNNKIGIQISANSELRNRSSDQLGADYVLGQPKSDGTVPLRLTGVSLQDREEYRHRFGGNLILDYDLNNWSFMLTNFYSRTNRDIRNRSVSFSQEGNDLVSSINNPNEEIDLITNLFSGRTFLGGIETDWSIAHSFTKSNWINDQTFSFEQPRASIPVVDFQTVYPTDLMTRAIPDSAGSMSGAEIFSRRTRERDYVAAINMKVPFRFGGNIGGEVKLGGRYRQNERSNSSLAGSWWVYLDLKTYPITDFLDKDYKPKNFLDGRSSIGIVLDPTLSHDFYTAHASNFDTSPISGETEYATTDEIGAGYIMSKLNWGQWLTFIPGVRYESFTGNYQSYVKLTTGHGTGVYQPRTKTFTQNTWLPMFHLKIKPREWLDFRLAATRTLSRPDFIQMAPFINSSLMSATAAVSQGNPYLNPVQSWNYDAYASFYSRLYGLFTFGWFYKEIDDVIIQATRFVESEATAQRLRLESDFYPGWSYVGRQVNYYENSPQSTVKGFEVDLQTNLQMLPGYLRGVVLNLNYSRIWSMTYLSYYKTVVTLDPTKFPPIKTSHITGVRSGRVPGQADHLVNFSLGYDWGAFSARVSISYQGKSLARAYTQMEMDSWNEAFTRWDFSARYNLTRRFSLFLTGVNLNNQFEESHFGVDARPTSLQYYGSMYDLGCQYSF
jgi:TonB-dependent receptor